MVGFGSLVSSSLLHKVVTNWILNTPPALVHSRFMTRGKWIVFLELRGLNLLVLTIGTLVCFFNFIKIDLFVELMILALSLALLSIFISWLRTDLPILAYWQFLFFLIAQRLLRLIIVTQRNFLKESVVK